MQSELAVSDLSQKDPVILLPVVLQNIIQPTPKRSATLFMLYDPSVVHMRDPSVIPSAIHFISSLGYSLGLMSFHIQFPPHVAMDSQNECESVGVGRGNGPL